MAVVGLLGLASDATGTDISPVAPIVALVLLVVVTVPLVGRWHCLNRKKAFVSTFSYVFLLSAMFNGFAIGIFFPWCAASLVVRFSDSLWTYTILASSLALSANILSASGVCMKPFSMQSYPADRCDREERTMIGVFPDNTIDVRDVCCTKRTWKWLLLCGLAVGVQVSCLYSLWVTVRLSPNSVSEAGSAFVAVLIVVISGYTNSASAVVSVDLAAEDNALPERGVRMEAKDILRVPLKPMLAGLRLRWNPGRNGAIVPSRLALVFWTLQENGVRQYPFRSTSFGVIKGFLPVSQSRLQNDSDKDITWPFMVTPLASGRWCEDGGIATGFDPVIVGKAFACRERAESREREEAKFVKYGGKFASISVVSIACEDIFEQALVVMMTHDVASFILRFWWAYSCVTDESALSPPEYHLSSLPGGVHIVHATAKVFTRETS